MILALTREPEDNQPLIAHFQPLGISVIEYPCIQTRIVQPTFLSVSPPPHLHEQFIDAYDVLIFSSRRGLEGFIAHFRNPPSASQDILCVGETTGRFMESLWGRKPTYIADPPSQVGIITTIRKYIHTSKRILNITGTKHSPLLNESLAPEGYAITSMAVYEHIEPILEPLRIPPPYVLYFASPSAVHHFFSANATQHSSCRYVSIGQTTTCALKEHVPEEWIVQAKLPYIKEVLMALEKACL